MSDDGLFECLVCHKKFKRRSLPNHIHSMHKLKSNEYFDTYIEPNTCHTCPICNRDTKFINMFYGYAKHCSYRCSSLDSDVQDKLKSTNKIKYGVDYNFQRQEIIEKSHTYKARCKAAQSTSITWNNKYGGHPMKTDLCKAKMRLTNQRKYKVDWVFQAPTIRKKILQNANRLIAEQECYTYLCRKYKDVRYHYHSDKYPYECDLYIKDLDLYIELNLFVMHGPHRFDPNNDNDMLLLHKLQEKAKTSDFYKRYIKIWTETDPCKLQTAINNNLNYLAFYNKKDFYDYFEKEVNING